MARDTEKDENTTPAEKNMSDQDDDKIEVEIQNTKETAEESVTDNDIEHDEAVREPEPLSGEQKTEAMIFDLKEKLSVSEDKYLRLAAEFDNFRKRTARQYGDAIKTANQNIIVELLEVVDNFQRALQTESNNSDRESLLKGIELVYQNLNGILEKQGLEPIEAVGKEFDPNLHEAMMQTSSDDFPEGVVVQELTKGYMLNGKVIRYSRVAVSSGPPESNKE